MDPDVSGHHFGVSCPSWRCPERLHQVLPLRKYLRASVFICGSYAVVVIDRERSVIGKPPPNIDLALPGERRDAGSGDLVVDPPADVLGPSLPEVRPPRVARGPWIEHAEDVDESVGLEDAREPFALLGRAAGPSAIAAPVREVDVLVRHVPVAADHELAPARAHELEPRKEALHESELARLRRIARRARGEVDRHDAQATEIQLQVAALRI